MLKQIVKFGDYYIDRDGHLLTLPSYMQFLLNLQPWHQSSWDNSYSRFIKETHGFANNLQIFEFLF